MLTASTAVQNTIKQALAVIASPRVIIEWNHNRYKAISAVDNWGSSTEAQNAYDPDVFPIESIADPLRPTAGILLGKTGEGIVTSGYSDAVDAYRTYTASPDSKYKYWTSQEDSGTTANGGGGYTIDSTKASPYVVYASSVWTNKIYLCFETSWAKPVVYNIDTTTDGTNWTTVATNVVPASDGSVTLYRQSGGTWTSSVTYANPTQLRGVRVVCSSVSKQNAFLNVIEMGLRLEDDVTSYLIDYSVDMEISEADFVAPIGKISSNSGSITLSNLDGRFNNDAPVSDPTPLYRGLIDANAKVTIDLGIDSSAYGGSAYEYLRVATMYSDTWASDDEVSTVELRDASKFLQELFPVRMLMSNVTVGKAVWRMLDSVGFNNYEYSRAAAENANKIPFFWTDSEKTVWEQIQDICLTTQAAVYFDAFGVLQIKTQQAAFDFTQVGSPVWTFDYALNGSKQPDIIKLTPGTQYEANKVTVHYKPTALAIDSRGKPSQEQVWAPEGDVVLRSTALKADMTSSQMFFNIDPKDASYWPYSGMVNIRGELIKYDGKQYRYVDKTNTWQTKTIKSTDEKLHVDKDLSSATLGYQNYFTGKMIVTQRGFDWTTAASHDTTIATWKSAGPAFGAVGGSQTTWTGGLDHLPADSIMRMTGRSTWTDTTFYEAPHSQVWAQSPTNIGMRFRFPKSPSGSSAHGGIFVHSNSAMNSMYLIDIVSTDYLDSTDARTSRDEVRIMKRDAGSLTSLNGRGEEHMIIEGIWYDVDLLVKGDIISVFINGKLTASITDASLAKTAKLGPYIRGYTVMDLEYFYYASQAGWPDPDTDNSSYLDLINGGYYSDQHYRDGFYRTREAKRKHGKRSITYQQKYAQRFFDEFGILVHEVRPYTIDFEKGPVTYSDLYFSNTSQVVCLEYIGTSFGASFILANASRYNSVVNGDDELTYRGNTINQILRVFGRTVQQQDEKTIEKKNAAAIKARGEVALDIASDWIQTEDHALDLANWIADHWSTPADEVEVEIFGNPLLELTDVVGVNYPLLNMTSTTHQYFVTKISQQYGEGGLSTTVTLRRARNAIY
jgi:hypothetical protein